LSFNCENFDLKPINRLQHNFSVQVSFQKLNFKASCPFGLWFVSNPTLFDSYREHKQGASNGFSLFFPCHRFLQSKKSYEMTLDVNTQLPFFSHEANCQFIPFGTKSFFMQVWRQQADRVAHLKSLNQKWLGKYGKCSSGDHNYCTQTLKSVLVCTEG